MLSPGPGERQKIMVEVGLEENTADFMGTRPREGMGGKTGMERGGLRIRCTLRNHAIVTTSSDLALHPNTPFSGNRSIH